MSAEQRQTPLVPQDLLHLINQRHLPRVVQRSLLSCCHVAPESARVLSDNPQRWAALYLWHPVKCAGSRSLAMLTSFAVAVSASDGDLYLVWVGAKSASPRILVSCQYRLRGKFPFMCCLVVSKFSER